MAGGWGDLRHFDLEDAVAELRPDPVSVAAGGDWRAAAEFPRRPLEPDRNSLGAQAVAPSTSIALDGREWE